MTVKSSTTTLDNESTASSDPLADAGQQAGESAGHLAERATDLGMKQADRGREQAAQGINQVAESIRRVGEEMQGEQPAIADAAQTAADQAERLASYLEQTDAREILRTVEDAARRQPLLFLGGAFVLGLAASRLVKAGTRGTNQGSDGRGSGYGAAYRSGASYRSSDPYRATGPGATSDVDELSGRSV